MAILMQFAIYAKVVGIDGLLRKILVKWGQACRGDFHIPSFKYFSQALDI